MEVSDQIVTMLLELKVFATTALLSPISLRILFARMITEEKSVFKCLLVAIPKYQAALEVVRCHILYLLILFLTQ